MRLVLNCPLMFIMLDYMLFIAFIELLRGEISLLISWCLGTYWLGDGFSRLVGFLKGDFETSRLRRDVLSEIAPN